MSTHHVRRLVWLWAAWRLLTASAGEAREAGPPSALVLPPVQRAVEHEDWESVSKGLTADPLTNSIVRLLVVRALYETGRLPEEQFAWFHAPGPELLATSELQQYMGASILADNLLQLGHLNAAERLAFDSLEFEGETPAVLRTLARLHAVKGLTNAAAVFLNRLQAYPEHEAWAVRFRAGLATNLAVDVDSAMSRIRINRVTRDRIAAGLTTERLLRLALEANPENRMACEFLLAQQLLSRELLQARQTLATAPQCREGPLPRAYAEAVLLHRQVYPRISLGNLLPRVPPAVASSFVKFRELLGPTMEAREAARPEAWREFGNTYWYYFYFGPLHPPEGLGGPGNP